MREIEIHGNNSSILSVSLKDVLDCVSSKPELHWTILWFEGIGGFKEFSALEFERLIKNSSKGHSLQMEELYTLSDSLDQLLEIIVIGDRDESNLKRYDSDDDMIQNCDLVLELVDSSYWVIHSTFISLSQFSEKLDGVKIKT